MNNITISEYGYIGCDNIATTNNKFISYRRLSSCEFKELYDFWLSDKSAQKVFCFESNKCLKAQSYVGVIQTQNISIEILPKIYQEEKEEHIRDIFISILKVTLGLNSLKSNKANLSITKTKNIFEGFISLFVASVDTLIKKGLKSSYIHKEDNQTFLKGKLKLNEHIKKNYIHKERFYVQFDEYLSNRVENKLLKSTINLLLKKTKDYENKKALRQQLFIFDDVDVSINYDNDISKINLHRGMEYYETPLQFTKVFLKDKSFSSLRGKEDVYALLFPMEKVFENYVEYVLKNSKDNLHIKDVLVNGGKNEYFLSNSQARLQPDYLLHMQDDSYIVTDAKWKLYDDEQKLNSNDIYQIFAYLNFYDCGDTTYLFVPKITENMLKDDKIYHYKTIANDLKYKIKIVSIDLERIIKDNHIFDINILKDNP